MALPKAAQRMEQVVRAYTQACNDADVDGIAACFSADAEFYFPWRPKWTGAKSIGANFAQVVREQGVRWTFDQLLTDVDRSAAVLGWTRFNSSNGNTWSGAWSTRRRRSVWDPAGGFRERLQGGQIRRPAPNPQTAIGKWKCFWSEVRTGCMLISPWH